jgi:hypothetical protein
MMMMVRRRLMVLLIAVLVGVFSTGFIPLPSPGILSVLARGEVGGGEFVTLAASSLSGISDRVPTVYYSETPSDLAPSPVDTSGWTGYDVTCESDDVGCTAEAGMVKFPAAWGCDPMLGNGTNDDGPAFQCQFASLSSQQYLYIPDGTGDYVLETFYTGPDIFIAPTSFDDQQGIVCESRNAVLSSRGGNDDIAAEDQMRIIRTDADAIVTDFYNEDSMQQNSTWTLTGDFSKGETGSFTTNTTHTLVAGDWVTITAERTGQQQNDDQVWSSKVATTPSNTTFTIEHPLPDTFGSSNIGATEWNPLEEFVIRDCTLEHEDGTHLRAARDDLITLFGCANCEISGNALYRGYQHFIVIENSADIWIEGNDTHDPTWDKGPNGYGFRLAATSRIVVHNNTIQHVQPVAVGAATDAVLIMFTAMTSPDRGCTDADFNGFCDSDGTTPTYDMDCDAGGSSNCQFTGLALHVNHTPQVQPDGYMHCSSQLDDTNGTGGNSGGCNGTPATGAFGCIEWHNGSGSQGLTMRNHCEAAAIWIDFNEGPGRDNFNFGNWIGADPDHDIIPFGREPKGSFVIIGGGAGNLPPDYRRNDTWSNNLFEGNVDRFDEASDGVWFSDNVIAGSCQYSTCIDTNDDGICDGDGLTAQLTDPTNGDCVPDGSELTSVELQIFPTNRTWLSNTVGSNEHAGSYTRTMPSLPGFTDWPSFDGDDTGLTPPFVGPEVGDPTAYIGNEGCLPAYRRWNGGSC